MAVVQTGARALHGDAPRCAIHLDPVGHRRRGHMDGCQPAGQGRSICQSHSVHDI